MSTDPVQQLGPCPVCRSPLSGVDEGSAEHDEWGRKMWDNPEVRDFECGRVECHYPDVEPEVHNADACAIIARMRPVVNAAVQFVNHEPDSGRKQSGHRRAMYRAVGKYRHPEHGLPASTLTCTCDCFPGPHEPRSCEQFTGWPEGSRAACPEHVRQGYETCVCPEERFEHSHKPSGPCLPGCPANPGNPDRKRERQGRLKACAGHAPRYNAWCDDCNSGPEDGLQS